MNRVQFIITLTIGFVFCLTSCDQLTQNTEGKISGKTVKIGEKIQVDYPKTQLDTNVVDDFFGQKIEDPFRWLEDDNSEETKVWVNAQNEVTYDYIDKIPYRDAIVNRLQELWNYEKYSAPFKEGKKYYYFKNTGLQNQSVLYSQDELGGESTLVIDPNQLSEDGTSSLAGLGFSEDGKYLAYGVSEGGSDWRTIQIKNLESGELLSDKIEWVKFSGISWWKDGFFYSRYPKPNDGDALKGQNKFHSLYYHKVGTPQSKDELVYADRINPKMNVYGGVSEDGRFLGISTSQTTSNNRFYFRDLNEAGSKFIPVVENEDNDYSMIGSIGDNILVRTNYKAPNYRLISINSKKTDSDYWEEVVPESEDVLQSVSVAGGKLICRYIKDAASQMKVYGMDGKFEYDIELPGKGTVGGFSGKKDENIGFYSFTSFTYPTTIYKYDFTSKKSEIYSQPEVDFNPDDYETKQVFYKSLDGTKVPMFITHKKGLELDGTNPTMLYGYGGFNISILPSFSVYRMVFLENNGVLAIPNIRGGGEYGRKWHDGGRLLNKQNVFDDFISAAEYLIDNKYTSKDKIAIEGRSNGGLLVGACMTQRPDLFKVALPGVGVLDMLRYHKFTIGRAWATDYGLSSDSIQFQYLLNYSPLHNIDPGVEYPATLVTTADHDDRVVPAHSFKFISELQRNHEGDNPVMIRIDNSAGHGAGKPTEMIIEEVGDKLSFTLFNLKEDVIYDYPRN